MDATNPTHARTVERSAYWLRSEMGLRDDADQPVAGPLKARGRCDVHGVGHGRAASITRFAAFAMATASAIALMMGARPAAASPSDPGHPAATAVGVGLGALSLAGFAAGSAIEKRTRYHVWLQCESRAVTASDVQGLLDAVGEVRERSDRAWTPDHAWLLATAVSSDAASLARANGVRCFVRQPSGTVEV